MAATHFESRFGEGLTRFVRRVVWTSRGTGSLAEFVLNAVRMVREQLGLERDELVSELTGRICAEITGQGIAGRLTPCPLPIDRPFAFRSVVDLSFAIKKSNGASNCFLQFVRGGSYSRCLDREPCKSAINDHKQIDRSPITIHASASRC